MFFKMVSYCSFVGQKPFHYVEHLARIVYNRKLEPDWHICICKRLTQYIVKNNFDQIKTVIIVKVVWENVKKFFLIVNGLMLKSSEIKALELTLRCQNSGTTIRRRNVT